MRKAVILLILIGIFTTGVSASSLDIPEVPSFGKAQMPDQPDTFGEGLFQIIMKALPSLRPDITEAIHISLALLAVTILISLLQFPSESIKSSVNLVGTVSVSVLLLKSTHSMIQLSIQVITELSAYSKLFIPAITATTAASGGFTSSASLYVGTTMFNAVLSSVICQWIVPLIYLFLAAATVQSASSDKTLKRIKDQMKKTISWILKTLLTIFTSYMSITGVVSGTTDAAKLKATRTAISAVVPVIGSTLADASESILVSAGLVKNAMGIYGIYAVLAVFLAPFLQIAAHYLILKAAAGICSLFDSKPAAELIEDFSSAMGVLLAVTGSLCLLLLISTICFLKGGK